MAMLDKLTLASATPKRDTTPTERFRRRLTDALDLQLAIARADGSGTEFKQTRQRWIKTEAGGKELREVPVRLRRWWWKDDAGKTYLTVRHGAKLLEIVPGKRAIEVGAIEDLPEKLSILLEAVRAGELDSCATAVSPKRPVAKTTKSEGTTTKAAGSKGATPH